VKKQPDLSRILRKVAKATKQTEEQVLATIDSVVDLLAPGFVFGYFSVDDIKQEARERALKVLFKYDPTRPLANFLYTHLKRRLINFKRDNFHRNDPPCQICHRAVGHTTDHKDGRFCKKYLSWKQRNGTKAGLMQPMDLEQVDEPTNGDVEEQVQMKELLQTIDTQLPVDLRAAYLQIRAGVAVSKERRQEVEAAVREILGMSAPDA
jgi:DNA-directed RNA polymerase specialized sigma24 family protein